MEKIRHDSSYEWLSGESWKEWSASFFSMGWKIWGVVLITELFLFLFFKPTADCGRLRYGWLFIVRPSGLQLLLLFVYRLLTGRQKRVYSRRAMAGCAIFLLTSYAAVMAWVHTSVTLMPMVLLLPMLLTPLYKDRVMTLVQAALLVVPVYLIAWLMQQFFSNFRHYTVWYGCLISALLLHLTNTKLHIFIDLASMHIPGVLFYPISIIGIYFVLSLSDLSERIRPLAKVLAFLGRHSFDIMAIHFTLFKLIDFAYARFILKEIPETLSNFPVSFRYEMGPFYILIGLFLPALIGWCIDRIAAKFLS
mgnify:CR=1 FL=1